MTRFIVRSRLGSVVINQAVKTVGPRFMRLGDKHSEVERYILRRRDTAVLVGVDEKRRVYLIGGFTDFDIVNEQWLVNGPYHHYADPKFIGILQEISNA